MPKSWIIWIPYVDDCALALTIPLWTITALIGDWQTTTSSDAVAFAHAQERHLEREHSSARSAVTTSDGHSGAMQLLADIEAGFRLP